jgi:L-rhamnose mutarotase
MERTCFYWRLFPGTENAFDRRLANLPGEVLAGVGASGLSNVTTFRRGTDAWTYAECEPDARTALANLLADPIIADWRASLETVTLAAFTGSDGRMVTYDEVFHANGGGSGPFERGMFSLVVAPARIRQYDARHADPWPEMMAALDASGFQNYSGFRRGSHVVYYGEFYPDMTTAVAAIGATEVNTRWSESFAGIITTLTDEAGKLIIAREVLHLD